MVAGSNPMVAVSRYLDGVFKLPPVTVGRHNREIRSMGYEESSVMELLVGSGKEVVLTIELKESVTELNEIVVTASRTW